MKKLFVSTFIALGLLMSLADVAFAAPQGSSPVVQSTIAGVQQEAEEVQGVTAALADTFMFPTNCERAPGSVEGSLHNNIPNHMMYMSKMLDLNKTEGKLKWLGDVSMFPDDPSDTPFRTPFRQLRSCTITYG